MEKQAHSFIVSIYGPENVFGLKSFGRHNRKDVVRHEKRHCYQLVCRCWAVTSIDLTGSGIFVPEREELAFGLKDFLYLGV